jgi:V8-like Glu-specific endopeptidase
VERWGRIGGLASACVAAVVLSSAVPSSAPHGRAAVPRPVSAAERHRPPRPVPAPPAGPAPAARAVPDRPPQDRVGAVFTLSGRARHYCTGSVVTSAYRNLVITAAHCVHGGAGGGYRTDLAFAPGLRSGNAPAGLWRVRRVLAAPDWTLRADPAADVAFLVVEPLAGREIEDVVGGNPIAFDRPGGGPVQLIGYPSRDDTPVVCDGRAERRGTDQLRVYCPGFSSGTSGSPWLVAADGAGARAGDGLVTGVIGGYETGGASADVSYSSYFDSTVRELYRRAVAASRPTP